MKRYFTSFIIAVLVLALVWVAIPAAQAGSLPAPARAYTWTLAWSDEFNDASIDTSKWQISNFMSPRNNEKNYYTPEDVYLSGGSLVIRAQQRSYGGAAYTSGQLISQDYVIPGSPVKIEMRVKAMNGQGLHGGFWAWHDDTDPPACTNCVWPPEIDLLEIIGSEPTNIYQTYHAVNSANDGWHPIYDSGINFTTSYHTVTAEWVPGSITFYYDGILNYTVANSGISEIDMKIMLDTSIGGNWPGMPDANTVFPNYAYVDYVRVYTGSGSQATATRTPTRTPTRTNTPVGPTPTRTNTPVGPTPTRTSTPASGNLLLNPGFETGSASSWGTQSATVGTVNPHGGTYAIKSTGSGGYWQDITGLSPNTTYTFSGWLKSGSTSQKGYLYAKNFGGTEVYSADFHSTTYTKVTITFTTGATNTSASVGLWRSGGTGNMFGDDFSLTQN